MGARCIRLPVFQNDFLLDDSIVSDLRENVKCFQTWSGVVFGMGLEG